MTLHIYYSHQCPKCAAPYIPYDKDVPCPRCGIVETERYDYVPEAAESLAFNLANYGSYSPLAWAVLSFGDQVLWTLFHVFESYRNSPSDDFETHAQHVLSRVKFGKQSYLERHILGIALRVREELEKRGSGGRVIPGEP